MDYEKEYKKIVGKIKKAYLHALTDSTNAVLEEILPELAESEDERIRKWLINDIKQAINGDIYNDENIIDAKKALAFLEKQGEKHQDPYNGISFEYNCHIWGMCARDNGVDISCDKHLIKHLEKQAEVKESTISQHENKTCEENGNSLTYEDEKVRKELLDFCKNRAEKYSNDPKYKNISAWITWLKSLRPQPKQKWSEEDSDMVEDIVKNLKKYQLQMPNYRVELQMRWLKSIKDRIQPKQEWSEDDINMIDWLIRCCEEEHKELCNDKYGHQDIVSDLKRDCRKKWDWLESLKNRVVPLITWKPSDEQIRCLKEVVAHRNLCGLSETALNELLSDLKKLKEGKV